MPSYAKSGAAYTVKIIIESTGSIQKAHCPCPAGIDGRCNHLAASLFAIEDQQSNVVQNAAYSQPTSSQDIPCTSKPCKWSVPPKKKCQPTTIQQVTFEKHVWKGNKAGKHRSKSLDRVPLGKQGTHDFDEIYERLKELENKSGKKLGLMHTIPHSHTPSTEIIETELPQQAQSTKWTVVSPISVQPMSLSEIRERASRAKKRLFESTNDREEIAQETLKQQNCRLWYDVRQPRITASQCKRCLLRETTSPTNAISEILMYKQHFQTKAMKDGIESEPKIIKRFMEETGHKVRSSGFVVSESHPFLGASPDGITETDELVEVKKVHSKEGEKLVSTMCRLGIYKHDFNINTNHKYYYQIQQQLFCTKLQVCHFIVSNGDEMNCDTVSFSSSFWNEVLPKLESFYYDHLLPELVYPRVKSGGRRWNTTGLEFPRME